MNARRLALAFGSALGARLAIAALNYGLFWWLARQLDADRLGGFSLVMNVFFLVQLLPLLGLSIPIIRRVAAQADALPHELSNAVAFAVPIAFGLALAIGAWGTFAYDGALWLPFWLLAAALLPTAWIVVAETCLVGRERLPEIARINLVESALRCLGACLAVKAGHGLGGVFAAFLLFRVATALYYLWLPGLPALRWSLLSRAVQRQHWADAPVYCSIALTAAVASRLDVIALSFSQGLAQTAVYSAAARLYEASQMVPAVLALVLMPLLSRQFVSAQAQFRESLALVLRFTLFFGIAGALAAAALAPALIGLLYQPTLSAAGPVLRWLLLAAALMLTDVLLSSTMQAARAQTHDLHALVAGLVALLAGLATGLPVFGAPGAAIAVVFSLVVRLILRLHWATRVFGMPPMWVELARILIAGGTGFAVVLLASSRGPWASMGMALAAYVAVYLASGGLGRNPRAALGALRTDFGALVQSQRTAQPVQT